MKILIAISFIFICWFLYWCSKKIYNTIAKHFCICMYQGIYTVESVVYKDKKLRYHVYYRDELTGELTKI